MQLVLLAGATFILKCSFDERQIPKTQGFKWNAEHKFWYTRDLMVAARLRDYAIGEAKLKLNQSLIRKTPWTEPLPLDTIPVNLMPHQIEAVNFALERNRCYLGLDPGLGKTAIAAVISTVLKQKVFYISPPFLVRNVEAEFKRWAPNLKVTIYSRAPFTPDNEYIDSRNTDVWVIPDSLFARGSLRHVHIEILVKHHPNAILFVDEAHRFKSETANRTKTLFGYDRSKTQTPTPAVADLFERQIYLSGTPMPNRPMELYPILSKAAPETIGFMNKFQYGVKYCAGYQNEYGWDFTGASNLQELRHNVIHPTGPFMLRLKKDLLDLPPKLEEVFVVSSDMTPRLAQIDSKLGAEYRNVEDLIKRRIALSEKKSEDDLHVMTYRRLLGLEKVKPAVEYINDLLDETDESLLIFAYHTEVIEKLAAGLKDHEPFVVTGSTNVNARFDMVQEFQRSANRRLFIGNYIAAGIGFTLTKATRVIFVEYDWVPGVNDQASDRAHRIGQSSSVLVQYMVYKDSIDKAIIETLLRKRKVTNYI